MFERWGRPQRIRVDNGHPWNRTGGLPSGLCLWLIGMGVGIIWNRARHPQENGKVERGHGVVAAWVEPSRCADGKALQGKVEWAMRIQREEYPGADGRSRMGAHPELARSEREYTREREAEYFDLERIYRFLSEARYVRHVDKQGDITLYNRHYRVGREHRRQDVVVTFDARSREWVIRDQNDNELVRHAAKDVTPENIASLEVGYTKPHRRARNVSAHPASRCATQPCVG